MSEPKLCYVSESWAYFTTQPVEDQWGDDWNDAPYEHNAGTPYRPHREDENWEISKVAFDADYETPDSGYGNSPYSVEQINRKFVAWLRPIGMGEPIFAGDTLEEFIRKIEATGGTVYLPQSK